MRMVLHEKRGMHLPEIVDHQRVTGRGGELAVCPGPGLPIDRISRELFGSDLPTTPQLGRYRLAWAAHSTDDEVLKRASSGGVMTEIARFLIRSGHVDGATGVVLTYGDGTGPRPVARIARSWDDLAAAQGSKYCPVPVNLLVRECVERGGKYLFCGTPCHVAALRLATRRRPELAEVFPFTMANFCGGFRDFRHTDWMITKHGLRPAGVRYFRYRGAGQPGSMCARTEDGREVTEPYPDYMYGSMVQKLRRCVFCIDGTGHLADFACGDAWLERYMKDESPWSIILARSQKAVDILRRIAEQGAMVSQDISPEDIIESQRSNLTSKILRQYKRMRVARLVGIAMPRWDVDMPRDGSTYYGELRTFVRKRLSRIRFLHWLRNRLRRR